MKYYGGTESPAEAEFLVALERASAGLPERTVLQHQITGEDYGYRVDFAWPSVKTVVEVNGWEWHHERKIHTRDQQKTRFLVRHGWVLIPFSGGEVMGNADYCVRELFRTAGWNYPALAPRLAIDTGRPIDAPFHQKPVREVLVTESESRSSVKHRWTS